MRLKLLASGHLLKMFIVFYSIYLIICMKKFGIWVGTRTINVGYTCVDVCKILKSTNVDKSCLLSCQLTV